MKKERDEYMGKNKDNLIKNSDLTPSERREKASKAGKASVEARRRKKTMRETLEFLLYDAELSPMSQEMLRKEGLDAGEMNHLLVVNRSLIAKAESGDVQAYNAICAMIGEKPKDEIGVDGKINHEITIVYKGDEKDKEFPASESELDLRRE